MSKIILHLDMNSYFASLEQQSYPNLRGKPIGVAGKSQGERTVVAGASMEAKKFGVKSGMSVWEARKLCPSIIIVPANYDRYIFTSKRIFSLMERFGPKVEVFSIDEAFLEISAQELNTPPHIQSAQEMQNHQGELLKSILRNKNLDAEVVSRLGFDTAHLTLEDWYYLFAADIALKIKRLISRNIGEWATCSIGISYGKTLAKLASERHKPDGLTVIRPKDFRKITENLPVEELCGIGYRLTPRLNQMGIFTIGELSRAPKETLIKTFGFFTGNWMHNISNGRDDNVVHSFYHLPQEKSVSHSYTLPHDLTSTKDVFKAMLLLSERIAARLHCKGLVGRTIAVYLRYEDFSGWSVSARQKDYLIDGLGIYQAARRLMRGFTITKSIRMISVAIGDLVQRKQTSCPLFKDARQLEALDDSIQKINIKYGEFTVFRSTLAKVKSRIFDLPDGRNKRTYLPQLNSFTKII